MSHYRLVFLEMLRDDLAAKGIDFQVIYGLGQTHHNIAGDLPWAQKLPLKEFKTFSWLPVLKATKGADLVVMPQVLRQLHLYGLLWRQLNRQQKIALWGHGKVFSRQGSTPLSLAFRYWVSSQAHWWFAYTQKSARVVRDEMHFAQDRITTVNNTIDTRVLKEAIQKCPPDAQRSAREALGIRSENVCLFIGGMYKTRHHDKRLPFLIEACVEIRRQIPDFELICIGGGPEEHIVAQAAGLYPWVHFLGIVKGVDTIPYWAMSKYLLVPGALGLVVLDAFATGTPVVTTLDPCHGPEVEYLRPNQNAIVLEDWQNPQAYAELVISLLRDEPTRLRLADECLQDASKYTTELMVRNFSDGIIQALRAEWGQESAEVSPISRALDCRAEVAFVVDAMSHYRETFFHLLQKRLAAEKLGLTLVHGVSQRRHNIAGEIPWAHTAALKTLGSFVWLSSQHHTRGADLVIVPQVMRHLHIYPYLWRGIRNQQKVAFWGHGKLFSFKPMHPMLLKIKQLVSRHCHWWFAYTDRSARAVREEIGYPAERTTVVNNTVDTVALTQARQDLTPDQLDECRNRLGVVSSNVGIFVGGMYHNENHTKRLPFLVASCIEIRKRVADFEMIFVGGGPEQHVIEAAAAEHPWMHYVGIQTGVHAVPFWALAKVCLNPGLVGLGILDALALGVPMITCDVPYHSPEIIYLQPGINGVIVDDTDDPDLFAASAIALMGDATRRAALAQAGLETVSHLTNEAMVERFTQGILKCLDLPALVGS